MSCLQSETQTFKNIFVTVGTTKFDRLIILVDSFEFQELITTRLQCKRLVVQRGQGSIAPTCKVTGLELSTFRLKPDIAEEFEAADLVICHAGAGSIMDAAKAGKTTIAVINSALMDNHQTELARSMADQRYLVSVASPEELIHVIEQGSLALRDLQVFPGINSTLFAERVRSYFA